MQIYKEYVRGSENSESASQQLLQALDADNKQ